MYELINDLGFDGFIYHEVIELFKELVQTIVAGLEGIHQSVVRIKVREIVDGIAFLLETLTTTHSFYLSDKSFVHTID